MKLSIDPSLKRNKPLLIAAWGFIIYAIIEITDSIAIMLIALKIIPNIYSTSITLAFTPIQTIVETQPVFLIFMFIAFTGMRITAAIGLMKNRLWGFWVAAMSLIFTILFCLILLPWGFIESFLCMGLLTILIIGKMGSKSLISK
ncbi:hypothetical protein NEF87_001124 [Candidatus Lokiarchaeum ossiferum]|uniref:DUF2127 domain-containing protein n=1 Tax=Candidatus Lokiarchaeum ossiferum TaxID=2951803 RepID=A0ABY6HQH9_9ARCH|nr:hypothetical protein NEF87_001124 [Candidatus Lokiarchaeum sp. B-35]